MAGDAELMVQRRQERFVARELALRGEYIRFRYRAILERPTHEIQVIAILGKQLGNPIGAIRAVSYRGRKALFHHYGCTARAGARRGQQEDQGQDCDSQYQ
jgi:hypothetical protein